MAVKGKQTAIFWHLLEGYWKSWEGGGEIPPPFGPSGGGEISPGGEIPPHSGTVTGGEIPPGGGFPYPLKICSQKMCELCLCALHINWTTLQH